MRLYFPHTKTRYDQIIFIMFLHQRKELKERLLTLGHGCMLYKLEIVILHKDDSSSSILHISIKAKLLISNQSKTK